MVLRLIFRRYQERKDFPKIQHSEKKVNDEFRKGVIFESE